jgi:hypothetical protein
MRPDGFPIVLIILDHISRDPASVPLFLDYLNSKHPNIKFTMEVEQNCSISFLDCLVTKCGNKFHTSVYRKPTFPGLGTSFFSFCSFLFKLNVIKTLINRGYNVCSQFSRVHEEFETLKRFFIANGFPLPLINAQIKKYLASKFTPQVKDVSQQRNFYCCIPYFGPSSETLAHETNLLFSKYFANVNLKVILVNSFKIGSFFPYKDTLPKHMRSSLVYKFSCARCASAYVGMTTRNLYTRVAEHCGRSSRTGSVLTRPPNSAIRIHAESCDVRISEQNFEILSSTSNETDLKILESLFIHKLKPNLNSANSSFPLQLVNR